MIGPIKNGGLATILLFFAIFPIRRGPISQVDFCTTGGPETDRRQSEPPPLPINSDKVVGSPQCVTDGKEKVTITCDYAAAPRSVSEGENKSRIVLNRAVILFYPLDENNFHLELTFTNDGPRGTLEGRKMYLSVDDDQGRNYVRRLTKIDFHNLDAGERRTRSDVMPVGIFRPGHYTIHIWIPDPHPALRFDPTRNFLFSTVGVPDPAKGLNTLADFTVKQGKHQKPRP